MALRPIIEGRDGFVVTEDPGYDLDCGIKTYKLRQVNRRERSFIPRMFANALAAIAICLRERPDVVVCTGVLATVPLCLFSKVLGAKLVYIESFAKLTDATETGRLLHRFADRFYVQWESMLDVYPDAICVGGVY